MTGSTLFHSGRVVLHAGDAKAVLSTLAAASAHCCITSPPYYGLRDYGVDGQIGQEKTPEAFVAALTETFREVRRVLRDDGTLWINLGDSYSFSGKGGNPTDSIHRKQVTNAGSLIKGGDMGSGLPPKNLIGIPWRVAFALQQDGWIWRQWLPWVKRNPMPESTRDRPTSACEVWLMFSKSEAYFYDYEAVQRLMAPASISRLAQDVESQTGSTRANGGAKTNGSMKAVARRDKQRGHSRRHAGFNDRYDARERGEQRATRAFRNSDLFFESISAPHGAIGDHDEIVALDVATRPFRGAHYATFPPDLVRPLIRASCPLGGVVLDPFGGSGTTASVAVQEGRRAVLIDLNPANVTLARARVTAETSGSAMDVAKAKATFSPQQDGPLFLAVNP